MRQQLSKTQRTAFLIAAAIGVAVALWFMRAFSAVTPEQVMTALFDVSAPTRFAFVSDAGSEKVAVVDLLEGRQVSTLKLQTQPDFWALSASSGKLIYASAGADEVFLRDTATHQFERIALPHRVEHWQYNDVHHWLFVAGGGYISRVSIPSGVVESVSSGVSSLDGMMYDAFLQKLWLIDGTENVLLAWSLTDGEQSPALYRYPLPQPLHDFAPLAATPDGLYLMIGASDAEGLYRLLLWDLTQSQWVPSRIDLGMSAMVRPYAGARGRFLWAFARDGSGVRVDIAPPHLLQSIAGNVHSVSVIATGWLDKRLLVAGDKSAEIYDTDSLDMVQSLALPSAVLDAFVTADSKSALLTVDGIAELYVLSLRDGVLNHLTLNDIERPKSVIMGASATLCH